MSHGSSDLFVWVNQPPGSQPAGQYRPCWPQSRRRRPTELILPSLDSKAIFPELLVALRSALRIGKPNDVSRSHYLHLNFSYSAEPPKLRQRFKLQTMHIFPYQRLLDDAQTEAQKAAVRACMRDCDAVQGSEGFLGAGVLREVFDLRFKPPLKLHSSRELGMLVLPPCSPPSVIVMVFVASLVARPSRR